MHVIRLILSLTLGRWGGDHVLRFAGAAHATSAANYALVAPHGTLATKTVHELPQPVRVCQSPLSHLQCIVKLRSQPCAFLREPHHIRLKPRCLCLCRIRCFLQSVHAALQVVNPLLEVSFSLPRRAIWGFWDPGFGLTAALASQDTCAQRSSTLRWSRVATTT